MKRPAEAAASEGGEEAPRYMTVEELIEVGRVAHELVSRMGNMAHRQAARYAVRNAAEGDEEEAQFWRWVEAALRPRGMA
jgi:hypothetical protein